MVGWRNSYNIFIKLEITVKAEPNIRIRIRGAIIRIQITETRIRTIIRISRQEGTHDRHNPLFQNFNSRFFAVHRQPSKTAQAEPKGRTRVRGAINRIQRTETRSRTSMRISRQEGTIPSRSS